MAIYQFYMSVVPKKGIVNYLGKIPIKLEADFEKKIEEFKRKGIESKLDYFEYISHKCWKIAEVASNDIIKIIDQKLERANWGNEDAESNKWKTDSNEIDNDAWILTSEDLKNIKEFYFRADLRQSKLEFLIGMINLAKKNEFLLMDINGIIVEPEIKKVIELVKKSNAFIFVENPNKFLSDLSEGKIKME